MPADVLHDADGAQSFTVAGWRVPVIWPMYCASLFWPVSEADAKYLLKALHVYSLENFKDQALHKEIATDELPDNHGRPAALPFPR